MPRRIPKARQLPSPIVAIDTNVFLEIHSCYDLTSQVNRLAMVLTPEGVGRQPAFTFRAQRAREALLLAMHLHDIGAQTYSLRTEAVGMLERFSPPSAVATDLNAAFATAFIHFVQPRLLPRWKSQMLYRPDGKTRDAADLALIEYATKSKIPIITHEGHTPNGITESNKRDNMRSRCRAAGVPVFTPREYYTRARFDEGSAISTFLDAFADEVPRFLKQRRKDDDMGKVLSHVFGIYRMILAGEVGYSNERIRTSLF